MMQYHLEGIDCPNCAAKIEQAVQAIPGVQSAHLDFMNKTLTVAARDEQAMHTAILEVIQQHDPAIHVCTRKHKEHHHEHGAHTPLTVLRLLLGLGVLVLTMALGWPPVLCLLSYAAAGLDVLWRALHNILHGRLFDENFLMALATVGAILIGEYAEAAGVMLFYQLGELFQHLAVDRSRRSVAALMDLRPDHATLLSGEQVSPAEVQVGTVLLIRPGDRIPLDCRVLEGASTVDTAALTGESLPRDVFPGCELASGCVNLSGTLQVETLRTEHESTAARMLELAEHAAANKAPAESFITRFARIYTPVVVGLAVLIALVLPLFQISFADSVYRALIFLVISCPCALVLSVPMSFFAGIGCASSHGILIKGGSYLDALSRVHTIAFDKTGTLTQGKFAIVSFLQEDERLWEYAAYAEHHTTHPIAACIRSAYAGQIDPSRITAFQSVPGRGTSLRVDGIPVLCGNAAWMEENGMPYKTPAEVGTHVYVAADGRFLGAFCIRDLAKPDAAQAVHSLRKLGVAQTVMLSGDTLPTARAMAAELGIDHVQAELLPHGKVSAVEDLLASLPKGRTLAYVGDGINDAPVLARADIGISMGAMGSDAAMEASDMVLMTDEPSRIADAIFIARKTSRIVRQNIAGSLLVKVGVMALGALGLADMWMAVLADVGVALWAVLNALRALKK